MSLWLQWHFQKKVVGGGDHQDLLDGMVMVIVVVALQVVIEAVLSTQIGSLRNYHPRAFAS